MVKPKIVIADEDANYLIALQYKFVVEFFDRIDLEIITDKEYFGEFFSRPQNVQILIVSDELYESSLQKHNIANIFVMTERMDEGGTGDLTINRLFKYSSIKEIFNEIVGKSAGALNMQFVEKKETQILLVTSAAGGVGKTTVAMGLAASLAQNYKRVLYLNASRLQNFQYLLDNVTPISAPEVYARLMNPGEKIYEEIKHVIRREIFSYLPAFKASLLAVGLDYSVFWKIAVSAKASRDYDFIVIDAESTFDEYKTNLIDLADKVMVITDQSYSSVLSTNSLLANINVSNADKYLYVCNKFDKDAYNAVITPEITLKFTINEYVEKMVSGGVLKSSTLAENNGLKKISFILL